MEKKYREAFAGLNPQQKQAVETTEGPVLVIAGPGTGKTQLIGTRVGHILKSTDTPADAILLLTFTEAGVQAMRERLNGLIGKAAYDVRLSTYHAFGGEIFRQYPDYFEGANLNLIEQLGSDTLLRGIIAKLPYSNPLKFADSYIGDIKSFISEAKRSLLSADDVEKIAGSNLAFISEFNKNHPAVLNRLTLVSKKTVPAFEELLVALKLEDKSLPSKILPLDSFIRDGLEQALEHFAQTTKTIELSRWKRRWLAKDAKSNYIIDGRRQNERIRAAAGIYRLYQKILAEERLYDYDDMILHAIRALQDNPELKYSLAERYSYIMLDEFQDTNPAQFQLVKLLSDHPVHEGRPNILAVGDDDQAIYAFQGADHANMTEFIKHYREVRIISLRENYRSPQDLVEVGKNIAGQIQNRVVTQAGNVKKNLVAANEKLSGRPYINAREFKSDAAQHSWVADEVSRLIKKGTPAKEIAILAPKHRYLTPLLPYLADKKLPVFYERRENVLDEPIVYQLEQMSRLVVALADSNETLANALWPEVLSYEFWLVPTEKIWSLGWSSRSSHEPWTAMLLNDEGLSGWADFFLKLAASVHTSTLEQQLDALIGLPKLADQLKLPQKSPLYDYYFSKDRYASNPLSFSKLISDLNVLRARLRGWRRSNQQPKGLRDFVEFIDGHRAAGINILNSSPYHESSDAVNLLTAYGAKGREFKAVFVVAAVDEVWGSASRNQGHRLSLPQNLDYIRYQGTSEDERLRLLYVAITRARSRLYFTSYRQDLAGKHMNRLKYMEIDEGEDSKPVANVLPEVHKQVLVDDSEILSIRTAENYWTQRHIPPFNPSLQEVLNERLNIYQLNATDLNHFLNIVDFGPDEFFINCFLRFPSAPSVNASFGTAIHNSLRFTGNILKQEGKLPTEKRLLEIFDAQLGRVDLPVDEFNNLAERGHSSLRTWLAQGGSDLNPGDRFEYSFQNEGSRLARVRLAGKVDRMIVDEKNKLITVVDYKTGRPYPIWKTGVIKLHMYAHQLSFYKLLIENSARFRGYKVQKGIIEFVEPDEDGKICLLELSYNDDQLQKAQALIKAVWDSIQSLQFPDVSAYAQTLAGIRKFEDELISKPRK